MSIKDVYEKYTTESIHEIMERYSKGTNGITWKGFKELLVVNKVKENKDITSFYFKAMDGSKLPKHIPGQFLTIKMNNDDEKYKNALRTYSLSMVPNSEVYRISVKRVEGGLISTYLHDNLNVGDTILAMSPMGRFTLKSGDKNRPLVLISGGIGITPLMSMLYEDAGDRERIYFVQAIQNSSVQTFKKEINYIMNNNKGIKNILFYNEPLERDILGIDYQFTGFIDERWIKYNLPLNSDFYFCGPPPFMKSIYKALINLGVNKEQIDFEFFGPKEDILS